MRYLLLILLFFPSLAFSIGGIGANCNPSTDDWGSCSIEYPSWASSVTNTVNVSGGAFSTPYSASSANTKYVLQGDVIAASTGFNVTASYVIIDLNGYTLTYNDSARGEGVAVSEWNRNHIAVVNGSIIQSTTSLGEIVSVAIYDGGSGYSVDDVLTLEKDSGSDEATVTVTGVDGAGVITGVSLAEGGLGYEISIYNRNTTTGYPGTITGGTGSGADIKITNTVSEGDIYGHFIAPVSTYSSIVGGSARSASDIFISNLYVKYYGRDVDGIVATGSSPAINETTIEDMYEFGTVKHRDQGDDAIFITGAGTIRNNTIINCRQRGIQVGNSSIVYGNNITTRGISTNAYGIFGYQRVNCTVYSNTITARGEHPIGIGFVSSGTENIEIYDNYIDAQTTALGEEYGGSYLVSPSDTFVGNSAAGFRATWGGTEINFHGNEIHIATNSNYEGTYSPTGATAYIDGRGKGLFIGVNEGETALFYNNDITVLDADGTGEALGISCASNHSDGLFVIGNTITSNLTNISIGNDYGSCDGHPLFKDNILIRQGSYSGYNTYENSYLGYYNSTARIVDSVYSGGASETDRSFPANNDGIVDIYFGTDVANVDYYSYRIHDNAGASSTLLQEDFDPAITLDYVSYGETESSVQAKVGSGKSTIGSGIMVVQ
jgi:hypothetical protein